MSINLARLTLILACLSSPLLGNPNTLRTIGKIAELTRMTSPTDELEAPLQEWLAKACHDPDNAMVHGWNFLTGVFRQIVIKRNNLLSEHGDTILEPDNFFVKDGIEHLNEGIGHLMRLLEIMGERAPSPIKQARSAFWAEFTLYKISEQNCRARYLRCITPPPAPQPQPPPAPPQPQPPAPSRPITILRPQAVHPETATPQNSPETH